MVQLALTGYTLILFSAITITALFARPSDAASPAPPDHYFLCDSRAEAAVQAILVDAKAGKATFKVEKLDLASGANGDNYPAVDTTFEIDGGLVPSGTEINARMLLSLVYSENTLDLVRILETCEGTVQDYEIGRFSDDLDYVRALMIDPNCIPKLKASCVEGSVESQKIYNYSGCEAVGGCQVAATPTRGMLIFSSLLILGFVLRCRKTRHDL